MGGEREQAGFVGLFAVGVVGVHAHRGEHVGVALGHADHPGEGLKLYRHAQGVGDAVVGHAGQHGGFVLDEVGEIQVAVGIYKHEEL